MFLLFYLLLEKDLGHAEKVDEWQNMVENTDNLRNWEKVTWMKDHKNGKEEFNYLEELFMV